MARKSFQGVWNIIRFNWPFYAFAAATAILLAIVGFYRPGPLASVAYILLSLVIISTLVSLSVSFYVYDLSGFYGLQWLNGSQMDESKTVVNINAGFDETTYLLQERFRTAELIVCDFYDPMKHTEASIRRARSAYPPFPGTIDVRTDALRIESGSVDAVFAIMSAHEIRDREERTTFLTEIGRVLSAHGRVVVVEHVRDTANFLAYNIGAFHFFPRGVWLDAFNAAKLNVVAERKATPFLTIFFLSKNGAEP